MRCSKGQFAMLGSSGSTEKPVDMTPMFSLLFVDRQLP